MNQNSKRSPAGSLSSVATSSASSVNSTQSGTKRFEITGDLGRNIVQIRSVTKSPEFDGIMGAKVLNERRSTNFLKPDQASSIRRSTCFAESDMDDLDSISLSSIEVQDADSTLSKNVTVLDTIFDSVDLNHVIRLEDTDDEYTRVMKF